MSEMPPPPPFAPGPHGMNVGPDPGRRNKIPGWAWFLITFALIAPCLIFAAILFPVFSQARIAAQRTQAITNVKQVGISLVMYTADHDDMYPAAKNWEDATQEYIKSPGIMDQSFASAGVPVSRIALNRGISQKVAMEIPDPYNSVAVFLSTISTRNAVGGQKDVVNFQKRGIIGFVDGSTRAAPIEAVEQYDWKIEIPKTE